MSEQDPEGIWDISSVFKISFLKPPPNVALEIGRG